MGTLEGVSAEQQPRSGSFDIRAYGAVGDGNQLNTEAIQAAIDACAEGGGGTVYFPAGRFLSGTIYLKSNVTLHLDAGAVLLGSTNLDDYPVEVPEHRSFADNYMDKSLIYAEKVENVSIRGSGIIDGQGGCPAFQLVIIPGRKYYIEERPEVIRSLANNFKERPAIVRMIECENITVKDITFKDAASLVQWYLACEDVTIDGISVHSVANHNNDGIDIDNCEKVRIANCEIRTGDDAIVLKSTSNRICKNVTVTNCILSSGSNGFKCGTESNGGFQDITVDNCTIYETGNGGISLELVDGGTFDRVSVSNITMRDASGGIFIRLGNRARSFKEGMERPGMGSMSNIIISNVQAIGVHKFGCSITGLPGFPVKNVTLENIRMKYNGGGTQADADRAIPELPEAYPEFKMFGMLSSYGFFVRHVENLRFQNLDLDFEDEDYRPAVIFEDVHGLDLSGFAAKPPEGGGPTVRFHNVRNALIHGCRVPSGTNTFLNIDGEQTEKVRLIGNDLTGAKKAFERDPPVTRKNVQMEGNLP